jgi:hypothetical protein
MNCQDCAKSVSDLTLGVWIRIREMSPPRCWILVGFALTSFMCATAEALVCPVATFVFMLGA